MSQFNVMGQFELIHLHFALSLLWSCVSLRANNLGQCFPLNSILLSSPLSWNIKDVIYFAQQTSRHASPCHAECRHDRWSLSSLLFLVLCIYLFIITIIVLLLGIFFHFTTRHPSMRTVTRSLVDDDLPGLQETSRRGTLLALQLIFPLCTYSRFVCKIATNGF